MTKNKTVIAIQVIAFFGAACLGILSAHASEITGTLSSSATTPPSGSQAGGTVGGSVGGGSTITGTITSGGGSTIGGTVTNVGGGGGSTISGSVLGASTGGGGSSGAGSGSAVGGNQNLSRGLVLGASTGVIDPGLPNTGEEPYGATTPWSFIVLFTLSLVAFAASGVLAYQSK